MRLTVLWVSDRRLVSISELCCVKCTSQPCSAKCADEFLPFHDQCSGRPAYVALMPLGGGSVRSRRQAIVNSARCREHRLACQSAGVVVSLPLSQPALPASLPDDRGLSLACLCGHVCVQIDDFESLAIKCKDPSVIAERHHAHSRLAVAKGGLGGTGEAALARLEQKHATMEAQLRQMKIERERTPSGGASADQSAAVAQLQNQVAELVQSVSQQAGVIQKLQTTVELLERQLADRDAAAASAAAAAAAAAAELVAAGAD